jgi:hypothetical protein
MKGHAGMGKTSIAQNCVEKLSALSTPFAAFFFFFQDRNKPQRFFLTIAYQIATQFPDYHDLLNERIQRNPTIVDKMLRTQFQELIMLPLQELMKRGKGMERRFPIIVDGLDECHNRDAQRQIVELIEIAAETARVTNLPLCWAFFSRPETHIIAAFAKSTISPLTHTVTLRKSAKTSREIERYLRESFQDILRRRNMPSDTQWPSDRNISRLVKAADGMFIYGATALRFIDDPQWLSLDEPLQLILESTSSTADPSLSPFADMDALYLVIMQRIPTRALPLVSLVLTFLCDQQSRFNDALCGTSMLGNCLGMSEMEMRAVCGHLSSVLLLLDQRESLTLPDGIDTTRLFLDLDKRYGQTFRRFVAKFEGSIGEVPGTITLSAPCLSVPSGNKLVNSLIMAFAYGKVHGIAGEIIDLPSTASELTQAFSECDHRKALYINVALMDETRFYVMSSFGCLALSRVFGAIFLLQIRRNFDRFDSGAFMQVRKHFPGLTNISLIIVSIS